MKTLVLKLLRDLRVALAAVCLLLGAFQVLWAKVTERILAKLAPFFNTLANLGGLSSKDIEEVVFQGPGKIIRTILGGEQVVLDNAMDMLSIGYVHPLMQLIFCIWAVGRAAGAIAGEIDRGTMELLLAQPLARWRLVAAHFMVDVVTIPILCLSLWAGNGIGAWLISPIEVDELKLKLPQKQYLVEFGPIKIRIADPLGRKITVRTDGAGMKERLRIEPGRFWPALVVVAGLIFAVTGYTMWLSALGRFRWRVLGLAVFVTLIQFLVNVLGQMWDAAEVLRPFTIFYYYQPQQLILTGSWNVTFREWNDGLPLFSVPMPLVLYGVGAVGYGLAAWTLARRDLPAPL